MKMHAQEINIDAELVQHLLQAQFPHWADLPLRRIPSAGTDNAIFRLGEELAVRLPRIDWATGQIAKETTWLPRLAPHLPLRIPEPVVVGEPACGYPYTWGVYRWLPGENIFFEQIDDPMITAVRLAEFLRALQRIDPRGGPDARANNLRGQPLVWRDDLTRRCIADLDGMVDSRKALALWEAALEAQDWKREAVWFHGDMLLGNVLFVNGRLSTVIDFGGLGVGDPACDLMIAWSLLRGRSRAAFREALEVDEATWLRGQGQALSQAVLFIPYYRHTNPTGVAYARRMLQQLLG